MHTNADLASSGCPFLQQRTVQTATQVRGEFSEIRKQHTILSSTGCTTNFCQSGRMTHIDEDRVGRNQSYQQVRDEAIDFLQQMHREGIFPSTEALHSRVQEVLEEIQRNSKEGKLVQICSPEAEPTTTNGLVGGTWTQTFEELEFGIRAAWKHARRCIMRSEYNNLKSVYHAARRCDVWGDNG
jgi:hypothetical protein